MKKPLCLVLAMTMILPAGLVPASATAAGRNEAEDLQQMIVEYYCRAILESEKDAAQSTPATAAPAVAEEVAEGAVRGDGFLESLQAPVQDDQKIVDDISALAKLRPSDLRGLSAERCKKEIIRDSQVLSLSVEENATLVAKTVSKTSPKVFNEVLKHVLADYANARHSASVPVYPKNPTVLRTAIENLIAKTDELVKPEIAKYRDHGTFKDGMLTFLSGAFWTLNAAFVVGYGLNVRQGIKEGQGIRALWLGRGAGLDRAASFRAAANAVAKEVEVAAAGGTSTALALRGPTAIVKYEPQVQAAIRGTTAIVKFEPAAQAALRVGKTSRMQRLLDFVSTHKGKIIAVGGASVAGGLTTLVYSYVRKYKLSPSEMLAEAQKNLASLELSVRAGQALDVLEATLAQVNITSSAKTLAPLVNQTGALSGALDDIEADFTHLQAVNASATIEEPIAENLAEARGLVQKIFVSAARNGGQNLKQILKLSAEAPKN